VIIRAHFRLISTRHRPPVSFDLFLNDRVGGAIALSGEIGKEIE
jgi:hypothetical protein